MRILAVDLGKFKSVSSLFDSVMTSSRRIAA